VKRYFRYAPQAAAIFASQIALFFFFKQSPAAATIALSLLVISLGFFVAKHAMPLQKRHAYVMIGTSAIFIALEIFSYDGAEPILICAWIILIAYIVGEMIGDLGRVRRE
jgi:hypothetical protein